MKRLIARQLINLAKELVAKPVDEGMEEAVAKAIKSSPIYPTVEKVLNMVKNAGGRGMIVGGSVRDAILGKTPKDIDLEIYGLTPDQLQSTLSREFEVDAVGKAFGVLKLKGVDVDISLPRRDSKIGDGHKGFLVTPDKDMSFEEATSRRDLTINAVMFDPLKNEIIDPQGGIKDLENHILRHVSEHFTEDPLRVLRTMQFSTRTGFDVADETKEISKTVSQNELPIERLGDEWKKMLLKGGKISRGLSFLKESGWIQYYPELESLSESDWRQMLKAADTVAIYRNKLSNPDDRVAMMMAVICWNLSESDSLSLLEGLWKNAALKKKFLSFRRGLEQIDEIMQKPSLPAVRRLAVTVVDMDTLANIYEAWLTASGKGSSKADAFRKMVEDAGVNKAPVAPIVNGVMLKHLGFKQGKTIGEIINQCYQAQMDGIFSDEAGARKYIMDNFI